MNWPTEVPVSTYHAVVADVIAQAIECYDDGPTKDEIVDFLSDICENFIDYAQCPYYQGTGACSFGCTNEPSCKTCEPAGGWPTTVRLDRDAEVSA